MIIEESIKENIKKSLISIGETEEKADEFINELEDLDKGRLELSLRVRSLMDIIFHIYITLGLLGGIAFIIYILFLR